MAALLVLPDWKALPPESCIEILGQTDPSKTAPSRLPCTLAPCRSAQPSPQAPSTELSAPQALQVIVMSLFYTFLLYITIYT